MIGGDGSVGELGGGSGCKMEVRKVTREMGVGR